MLSELRLKTTWSLVPYYAARDLTEYDSAGIPAGSSDSRTNLICFQS